MAKLIQELWVEGSDDQHVIWGLCKKVGLKQTFEVKPQGNDRKILAGLKPRLVGVDQARTLGIVIDADNSASRRWKSIHDRLEQLGYDCPKNSNSQGLIVKDDRLPTGGVWIMPDNEASGKIENFLHEMILESDELKTLANATLDKIENDGIQRYRPVDRSKAFIHTWLAWQHKPGIPMGQGIGANYFDLTHPTSEAFISWLKNLFKA